MSLKDIRRQIDTIDVALLDLLDQRMALALRTKKLKPAVRDAKRERDIVSRLTSRAEGASLLTAAFIEELYGVIFKESRRLQAKIKFKEDCR